MQMNFISWLLTVITVFIGIFAICSKKWCHSTYWDVLTIPDNKNTWEKIISDALLATKLYPLLQDKFGE
jgi:hypothetical protein